MNIRETIQGNYRFVITSSIILVLWPYVFYSNPVLYILIAMVLLFLINYNNKVVFLLIPLCFFLFPPFFTLSEDSDSSFIGNSFIYATRMFSIPIIYGFYKYCYQKKTMYQLPLFNILVYALMCLGYYVLNRNINDIYNCLYFIIFYILFYAFVREINISFKQICICLDIIFWVLAVFAILEFFFRYTPYDFIYYTFDNFQIEDVVLLRTKSLCGHPLIMVGFLSFYQISLYARYMIYGNLQYVIILTSVFVLVSIISLSRTIIYIDLIVFLLFLFQNKKSLFNGKLLRMIIILLVIVSFVINYNWNVIEMIDERFSSSSLSYTNRFAAYEVSQIIFDHYPFGCGESLKSIMISLRYLFPTSFEILVLDNSFLEIICHYGIFCFVYVLLIVSPFKNIYRLLEHNSLSRKSFYLLVAIIILLSFSYTILTYRCFWVLIIVMLKLVQSLKEYEIFYTNTSLQD